MTSVLTIGYGKQVFDEHDPERARLRECAEAVGNMHMVIFSRIKDERVATYDGALSLYPTNARTRIGMLFSAYMLGSKILSTAEKSEWIISTQDPFEAGLIGYLLHLRYGVPLQVQEHGDFFGTPWWRTEHFLNRLRYRWGAWLLRRASCVRTVSERARKHLMRIGVVPKNIQVLSVMSALQPFLQGTLISESEDTDLRARYPHAKAIIIGVGRLVKQKRFEVLIDAFKIVVAQHPSAKLVIIGSGPEESVLKERVRANVLTRSVDFIPWTDNLPAYMASADIFTLSSAYEGWGRVILEAMAAGLPGVVTDVGCAGEVFIHGVHGAVVPVGDAAAFANALSRMVEDESLRTRYSDAAKKDIVAYLTAQESYAEAWSEVMRTCKPSRSV